MISQMTNTFFPICSFFVSTLILIVFKSKKVAKNQETNIYSKLVYIGVAESFLMFMICLLANLIYSPSTYPFFVILNKLLCSLYVLWITFMLYYLFIITKSGNDNSEKIQNIIKKILFIITPIIIFAISISSVDITYIAETKQSMALGPVVYITYTTILLYTLIGVILIASSYKTMKDKKKLVPALVFSILILISLGIFSIDQYFNINSNLLSFTLLIMYFTIENPDVKMLEEVSLAKEQAEKANTAKSEFLSNMSHEIRTPLNAIVGFSESLKEDNIPKESKEKVEDIITASQNLLEIVNGILDISKIEANKLEIINKEYDPQEMFHELVSLTKARIGDKGLDFQVNIDQTIPSVLYGDNARIKQIILNILTNAVKYTKEGYVIFTVSSVIKDNVCRLIVSVEDSGIGIKQESLPKLFSKFERLNVEKQLTIEGTGLGLAITKKLLDLMNGTIIVQSVYGKGSKFTISLDQRIISIDTPLEKKKPEIESKIVDANGAKLLIVDDNEMNIKVAMTLLKKYHFDIDSCNSGLSCLAKLKENKYDIIFLDDMMPKMSGKETLAKIKENPSFKTPVIALTANALTGMKEDYLSSGFNDYLSKPIERPELERIIKEFIMKDNKQNINSETSKSTTSIIEKVYNENEINPAKEVLVIDNNVYTEKVLDDILKKFNVTITSATNEAEAISNVIDKKYDIIFMDDGLVDKNYEKLMEDLTSISGFNTPVVLMTSHTPEEIKESIEKCGFDGYISKPIDNVEVESIYTSIVK